MTKNFYIDAPEVGKLKTAFDQYPDRFRKYFSRAINAALAVLSRTAANDSIMQFKTPRAFRTGMLQLSFDLGLRHSTESDLTGSIGPTVGYALMVLEGTRPHEIKNAFGRKNMTVHHPGSAGNPFMQRIMSASKTQIDSLFDEALTVTVRGMPI